MLVRNQYRESLGVLRAQQGNFSAWLWSGGNEFVNSSVGMNFTLVCPYIESDYLQLFGMFYALARSRNFKYNPRAFGFSLWSPPASPLGLVLLKHDRVHAWAG